MLFPLRFEKPHPGIFFFPVSLFLKGAVGQMLRRIPLDFSAPFPLSLGQCHKSLVKTRGDSRSVAVILTGEGRAPAPPDEPEFLFFRAVCFGSNRN